MADFKVNSRDILASLEMNHFKGGIVSIDRIRDLKNSIENLNGRGQFDRTFYDERLTRFDYDKPELFTNVHSIIIATIKQPIVQVEFRFRGAAYRVIVPPTYDHTTDGRALHILKKRLQPEGFTIAKAELPQKLLLVCCGIGKYGRNNIAYVEGMGSYHRPVIMVTDAKLEESGWTLPVLHERCAHCRTCSKGCPTGAISSDHFLSSAEKCLTFHNERVLPFPNWIKSEWHNCLVGCMICQNICPLNRGYIEHIEYGATFSEDETEQFINRTPKTQLADSTIKKLQKISLLGEYELLGRNLTVLLGSVH